MPKIKKFKGLRLILGDQLNASHSWYKEKGWLYVMMEIKSESEYVTHHIQKIVGIFSSMRTFAENLAKKNLDVKYFKINDQDNAHSFAENVNSLMEEHDLKTFEYQQPDEWRLDQLLQGIEGSKMVSSEHFLTERNDLEEFFEGKKTYLMESFYREMRKRHNILMDGSEPYSGKWNYDKSNRKKLPTNLDVPPPFTFSHDVRELVEEIKIAELRSIGTLHASEFLWPKDEQEANEVLSYFIEHLLPNFGDFQDAMSNTEWSLYHSRISFALNVKMISPLDVIQKVQSAFYNRKEVEINAAEGFIRQILGWREYMRGIYWAKMPEYKTHNFFNHSASLPEFYWNGETKMNCLSKAINQSLEYAYAHHIQRLMVTGNFALLAGVDPDEVDLWYLGIYIDAFEWVEITNTRGMSQFADGGIVATKPYVSSASYIHKMGDHCKNCHYDHKKRVGESACPFNSLYWNFIDEHYNKFENNPRMSMMLALWDKMEAEKKEALLTQATYYLEHINEL